MNYLKINDDHLLDEPAKKLQEGEVVVFKTETVYGIGVNALDEEAVKRLYKAKQREATKPTSVLVSNYDMVKMVAKDITDVEKKIMDAFFPGSLTIILKQNDLVPDIVTAGTKTIGVRMPSGKLALKLVEKAGVPLATSSANIADHKVGINMDEIMSDFGSSVSFYLDDDEPFSGVASTVVKVVDGVPKILREGTISEEDILKVIND